MKHPFHIVDNRPWPITASVGALLFTSGIARSLRNVENKLLWFGLALILITIFQWWRDVSREASLQGKHTTSVEVGLRSGMLLFITREVFFFFTFFWAYFHASLSPNVEIGSRWPPVPRIDPFGVPLLNTTVLLSRGATITWAHMAVLSSHRIEAGVRFAWTVMLGIFFTLLQVREYLNSRFTISDSVYGRTFFLATGFHGLHVVIGTLFILVMWIRHCWGHFSRVHHFGFEASAWYWHFVDVVWLFLYVRIYWWGF